MKIIRLLTILLCLSAWNLTAQTRNCDLSLNIVSPTNNFVVPFGDTVVVFISIKNNGPDSILVSDTIGHQLVGEPYTIITLDSIIAPGDSIIVKSLTGFAASNQTLNDTNSFCLKLVPSSTFNDTNNTNNESCLTVIFLGSNSTSIGQIDRNKIALQIFPNPVANRLNLAFSMPQSERVEIAVTDILGREVRTLHKGYLKEGSQEMSFANNLKAGIYWLKISSNHVNVVEKMIVR